jgi:ABC-type uncharacterized transport system fused permease/ATPase subunit
LLNKKKIRDEKHNLNLYFLKKYLSTKSYFDLEEQNISNINKTYTKIT